jgi:hypothetical protein
VDYIEMTKEFEKMDLFGRENLTCSQYVLGQDVVIVFVLIVEKMP